MNTATETVEQTEAPTVEAEETKTEAPAEEKPAKAPKVDPTKNCLCSSYEITDTKDESGESTFTTGCEQTTKRTFAQGHDARLVSFLVDGHFDGYTLRQAQGDGTFVTYASPVEAVAGVSEPLRLKAEKAVANRSERDAKKAKAVADREAAKAAKKAEKEKKAAEAKAAKEAAKNAPKDDKAKVVEGSQEGDAVPVDLTEGTHTIKVGRRTFENAVIDGDGTARYLDGEGNEQTVVQDGYRLIK